MDVTVYVQTEIIFAVQESPEGGFEAKALSHSIYTEAETLDELKKNVRDAVRCHFEDNDRPSVIRLHLVKGRGYFCVKLPRDLGGFVTGPDYSTVTATKSRANRSHLRLTSKIKVAEPHITIPAHDALKVGTLSAILTDIAAYLEINRMLLFEELFSR